MAALDVEGPGDVAPAAATWLLSAEIVSASAPGMASTATARSRSPSA